MRQLMQWPQYVITTRIRISNVKCHLGEINFNGSRICQFIKNLRRVSLIHLIARLHGLSRWMMYFFPSEWKVRHQKIIWLVFEAETTLFWPCMLFYGFLTAIFNWYHVNVNKHNALGSDFRRNPCCNGQLFTNSSYLKNNKWCNTFFSMSQIFHHASTLTDIISISFQKRYPLYKQVIQAF